MKSIVSLALASVAAAQLLPVTPAKGTPLTNLPSLGLGTWFMKGTNATEAVAQAIVDGYRLIDAATLYGNQREVGAGIKEGIKRAGISRKDLWITSKLWNTKHDDAVAGLQEALDELGVDYLDLFLVHWPQRGNGKFDHVETWKRMEALPASNKTRFIGVANHSPKQLQEVLAIAKIKPHTMQIELHPYLPQDAYIRDLQSKNITVNAYSPLGNTNTYYSARTTKLLQHATVRQIATARNCSPAQVVLGWNMKRNISVIPKAVRPSHWKENVKSDQACKFTPEDIKKIDDMSKPTQYRFAASFCAGTSPNYDCWTGLTKGF